MQPSKAEEPELEVDMEVVPSTDADRRLRQALDLILRAAQRGKKGQAETENEPLKEHIQEGTDG
jgi:hypothetical protein